MIEKLTERLRKIVNYLLRVSEKNIAYFSDHEYLTYYEVSYAYEEAELID